MLRHLDDYQISRVRVEKNNNKNKSKEHENSEQLSSLGRIRSVSRQFLKLLCEQGFLVK